MIALLFVGDGERDRAVVPALVGRILGHPVREDCLTWRDVRLNRGRGLERKLAYLVRSTHDSGQDGLVATVDADRNPERLGALRSQREAEQRVRSTPVVVAQADPHSEAWLLDDAEAVKEGLGLQPDTAVPNVRRARSPKKELEDLLRSSGSGLRPLDAWAEVARRVVPARCRHAAETGFAGLVEEVSCQLRPVLRARGTPA